MKKGHFSLPGGKKYRAQGLKPPLPSCPHLCKPLVTDSSPVTLVIRRQMQPLSLGICKFQQLHLHTLRKKVLMNSMKLVIPLHSLHWSILADLLGYTSHGGGGTPATGVGQDCGCCSLHDSMSLTN